MARPSTSASSLGLYHTPLGNISEETEAGGGIQRGDRDDSEEEERGRMYRMDDLVREYEVETDNLTSIAHRVLLYASARPLDAAEVFDRGKNRTLGTQRFGLTPSFFVDLELIVDQMQSILDRAAIAVPQRISTFKVDPRDTLLPILKNSPSLEILTITWTTLQKRLELANKFFSKYQEEYKTCYQGDAYGSPVSTAAGVYGRMPIDASEMEKLKFFYEQVHNHRRELPVSFEGGEDWLAKVFPVDTDLKKVFPPEMTSPLTASSDYERRRDPYVSARSSWGRADFQLPQDSETNKSRTKGKNKAQASRIPTSPRGATAFSSIPGLRLPDPLTGVASAAPFHGYSESVSQARSGQQHRQRMEQRDFGTNTTFRLNPDDVPSERREREVTGNPGGDDYGNDGDAEDEEEPRSEGSQRRSTSRSDRNIHPPRRGWRPPPGSNPPNGGGGNPGGGAGAGNGGGGDGNGNGGGAYKGYPHIAPGAPYGNMVPTIEPKFKVESLPTWDGDHKTAIDYFWEVSELANLRGWMPEALGFWLPTKLKKDSSVQLWFTHLPISRQDEMRKNYLVYLQVIRDKFLGKRWLMEVNAEFDQQRFRQKGHEDESPQKFIGRRIRSIRLLANADDGGPLDVFLIMKTAPIPWSTILVLENIGSSEELYEKVNEHYEALIESYQKDSKDVVTLQNLSSNLRKLGWSPPRSNFRRTVNWTAAEGDEGSKGPEQSEGLPTNGQEDSARDEEDSEHTLKQVFQTLKKRQRPPPKGGYPFPKHDDALTKMGRLPPSPCKVCGSAKHWDKECPDWNVYIEKQKRGVLSVSAGAAEEEADMLYHQAYLVLLDARINDQSL
ncbi:hypothetical protein C8R45DRAFT_1112895 [Mycena sanguinolenta]|nr:hypothetical protein C8R45DRAFT_1112895 [Mycena sanguinolenta]